jgi:hypothetical protein
MRKELVEAVDMALVLHQRRAGEVVEALDVVLAEPGFHAFEQLKVFAQRDRHARRLQLEEERDEHRVDLRLCDVSRKADADAAICCQPSMSYSMKPVRRATLS